MSSAATEKPVSPLGSFLTKLTPAPAEKPADKPDAKVASETNKSSTEVKTEPLSTDKQTVKVEAPVKADQQAKTVEAPKETTTDTKVEPLDKQLASQAKANLRLGQENADLRRTLDMMTKQNERIEKKLDGTYEEPKGPSPEQATADADTKGRIRASHHAAVRQYGQDFVMSTVWATDSPYQELQANSPAIRARVMEADDPVLEAIAVVKEHQDGLKYGRTPEEIRKKMEAELTPKITQDILEGLKSKPGPATKTLGNVRGDAERVSLKNEAPSRLDFRAVFPWGASRA